MRRDAYVAWRCTCHVGENSGARKCCGGCTCACTSWRITRTVVESWRARNSNHWRRKRHSLIRLLLDPGVVLVSESCFGALFATSPRISAGFGKLVTRGESTSGAGESTCICDVAECTLRLGMRTCVTAKGPVVDMCESDPRRLRDSSGGDEMYAAAPTEIESEFERLWRVAWRWSAGSGGTGTGTVSASASCGIDPKSIA